MKRSTNALCGAMVGWLSLACASAGCGDDEAVPVDAAAAESGDASSSAGEVASDGGATGSDAATSEGADGATLDPSTPPSIPDGTPVYEVPVSSELAPYARYPVPEVVWAVKNGERRLEYVLPADLVGAPQQVELAGPDVTGSWTLAGESFGTATCTQTGARVVCTEKLAGVPIDMTALEQRAAAGELSPEQLQVARTFASDPIGILHFDAP